VLLLIAQISSIKIFDYFERESRAKITADEITSVVNLTRASIASAANNKRIKLLSYLSGISNISIYPAYYFEPLEPIPDDPYFKLVVQNLEKKITFRYPNHNRSL
jgi:two-component system osmolarity sensor histidine kinase EnvZ